MTVSKLNEELRKYLQPKKWRKIYEKRPHLFTKLSTII